MWDRHRGLMSRGGQTAIEYLLIFTIVAVVVLVAFKSFLPRTNVIANDYFNRVADAIMGPTPK